MSASSAPNKLRAFIALRPPGEWIEHLARIQDDLRRTLPGKSFRWVNPDQIHITLRFLGSITSQDAEAISEGLNLLASLTDPFSLALDRLGCFPNVRRPRVLWAGLTGGEQQIQKLNSSINAQTAAVGEPPEPREFKPHLTLARIKETSREEIRILTESVTRPLNLSAHWDITELLLMRSHVSSSGSRYEVISSHTIRNKGPSNRAL
jgi:RNA 2',3'-cyclic 3'-phosphodiesterase